MANYKDDRWGSIATAMRLARESAIPLLSNRALAKEKLQSESMAERLIAVLICSARWSLDVEGVAREVTVSIARSGSGGDLLHTAIDLAGRVFAGTADVEAERAIAQVVINAKDRDPGLAYLAYLSLRSICFGGADPDLFATTLGALDFALECEGTEESENSRNRLILDPMFDQEEILAGRKIDWQLVLSKAVAGGTDSRPV